MGSISVESLRKELAQVREESLTDALTGIANRKAFDQALEKSFQDNAEKNTSFCVVIADIDFFKKFNDTFGHLVGDKVLRFVAATIKSCVKGKDTAARFGGEEFVLILPDTGMEGAEIVAEQVRKAISKSILRDIKNNEEYGKITISLGIGQFKKGELTNDLLKRADEALYQAKENGRNRVEKAL
ncbi:MAG: GGDEF domain-containing protein [Gammaproteobacteria bacterium]|nr:GGDEF domain-containing protein [Gammaproteobacteria bacterium]MBT3722849.1 GGDEF domain-containing protein [Gammaproteobacteria bacterium]MBT4194927.1 GGDEF domain-containing protein [Gammaproteobacteria bacterium]MBT4449919.1 GGDEF domain-containing protein [Gammaproteobacteria bacterium]MBT4860034.1 GGDEF domain-containing protein [Gammaproteobacteria bacterium]